MVGISSSVPLVPKPVAAATSPTPSATSSGKSRTELASARTVLASGMTNLTDVNGVGIAVGQTASGKSKLVIYPKDGAVVSLENAGSKGQNLSMKVEVVANGKLTTLIVTVTPNKDGSAAVTIQDAKTNTKLANKTITNFDPKQIQVTSAYNGKIGDIKETKDDDFDESVTTVKREAGELTDLRLDPNLPVAFDVVGSNGSDKVTVGEAGISGPSKDFRMAFSEKNVVQGFQGTATDTIRINARIAASAIQFSTAGTHVVTTDAKLTSVDARGGYVLVNALNPSSTTLEVQGAKKVGFGMGDCDAELTVQKGAVEVSPFGDTKIGKCSGPDNNHPVITVNSGAQVTFDKSITNGPYLIKK